LHSDAILSHFKHFVHITVHFFTRNKNTIKSIICQTSRLYHNFFTYEQYTLAIVKNNKAYGRERTIDMTDGFERNDMNNMNNMNSENEQVQNSFSTAGNSQTDTSANASGYNAGSSYTSSYDAQQNAYNSYYNYANGANNTGANNTGANNIHVAPGANKPPKKNGKGALVAGIIAAALVVGGGAGFAGTVLGNSINATIPFASSSDGTSQGESADSGSESTIAAPSTTLNTSSTATAAPLDESKINDSSNSTLLNAEELYEKVKNTVVLVYNYQRQTGYAEPVKYGSGSGVVFTSDGYVITNAHVVEGADKMTVVAPDYKNPDNTKEYEATVVGSDTYSDLAVLKISRDDPFEYATLGDSDTVRVGQDVCVLGNPKQLLNSLTKGIVSGLGRASASNSAYGTSTIQIDAAINSGNSGGGLFDMYGNVIGIIDYKLVSNTSASIDNIGFAITINEAKPVINDLMTKGYVTNRPGLGINGEEISEYSAYMQGLESGGVYVTYISKDMPVAKSGLKVGDIISKVNGTAVTSVTDIQNIIAELNIGDTVELTVYRAGATGRYTTKTINVELAEIELS